MAINTKCCFCVYTANVQSTTCKIVPSDPAKNDNPIVTRPNNAAKI